MFQKRDVVLRKQSLFGLTTVAILTGLILSLLSWFEICTEACGENHKYLFFGAPFSLMGIIYFSVLLLFHFFSSSHETARLNTSLLLIAGLGAETLFIFVQKSNGTWCPLCLGIAASVLVATLSTQADHFLDLSASLKQGNRTSIWDAIKKPLLALPVVFLGIAISLFGISKVDENAEEENALEEKIVFGQEDSPIEIYVFTSWICPACKKFEPRLERMMPDLLEKAKVTFVDYGEDMTTLNFLPYNLSFMLHNKDSYLLLRHMLKEIAAETETPNEAEIEKEAKKFGIQYIQLNYAEIAFAVEYFKDLARKFKIRSIPAMVIVDKKTDKQVILVGSEIIAASVRDAIAGKSKKEP